MTRRSRSLQEWLASPLGRRCLANEQRLVRRTLDRVFGEQLLQIGLWGEPSAFLRYARTQRRALIDWREDTRPHIVSDSDQLAISSDSIDAVVLPHTLEQVASPHALLREVGRVLRPDGHLLILSFAPAGPWGLRHLFAAEGYPPGHERMIREGRLRDWLELLSFEVSAPIRYCHTLPFEQFPRLGTLPREDWARRWLPMLAGAYLLSARKRVRVLTPIRPLWHHRRLKVVGGLVEPTTRAPHSRECG